MKKNALQIFTLEQSEEWDKIVKCFSDHNIYYLSGYVKTFKIHGDGEPLLFYYNDGKTRGINVVFKRSIKEIPHFKEILEEDRYCDFTTPYGYGGWLIEGEPEQLFQEYEQWCSGNNIVSEFVRFHPILENHNMVVKYYDVVPLGETVAIDLTSPEEIWGNISSKNRNVIRKAIKNNVRIYNGHFPEIFEKFKYIYNITMDREFARKYYYFEDDFYQSVLEDIPENSQIFYAQIPDGTIIAASIMLSCNGQMNYHLSGSLREYSSLAATNLLIYKTALWGCAHGFKVLLLGGGVGSENDSLLKFKKAFNRNDPYQFYIGRKIFNTDIYQNLTLMHSDSIINSNHFPLYRG